MMKELNEAYQVACEANKPDADFGEELAALTAGKPLPPEGRFERFDAITAAMQQRWSELANK
jgi:hypothetical protein